MAFSTKDLKYGDTIFIRSSSVYKVYKKINPEQAEECWRWDKEDADSTSRLFTVLDEDGDIASGGLKNTLNISDFNLKKDVCAIYRDGRILYPRAMLTPAEKSFLDSMKPLFKSDTFIIKLSSPDKQSEYIRICDVVTNRIEREDLNLPYFEAGKYYKNIPEGEYLTLDSLNVCTSED